MSKRLPPAAAPPVPVKKPSVTGQAVNPVTAIRGLSRLGFDAVEQVARIVESMHLNISSVPWILAAPRTGRTGGITGLVYSSIHLINRLSRDSVEAILAQLNFQSIEVNPSVGYQAFQAALNGVMGDHLETSNNPLALHMQFRSDGIPLVLDREKLAAHFPQAGNKLLVAVHGLCMNDLQWTRNGHNHAAALASEFGYTPVYLQYNSGRHVSINGHEFAALLESLVANWPVPVEEVVFLVHSMGGLVTRSACVYGESAGHAWRKHVCKILFLGTPHHGAPLERGGNWLQTMVGITPYSAPLARLGMVRSAGVTDLRHGNVLDEDWQHLDRFKHHDDRRQVLALPANVVCYTVAASTGLDKGDLNDRVLGDGLVKVASALGKHADPRRKLDFPAGHQCIFYATNHWDLLDRSEVYQKLRQWLDN